MVTEFVMFALVILVLYGLIRSTEKDFETHLLQRVKVNKELANRR